MKTQAFLDLSTQLCKDLNEWISVAHRDGALDEHQLKVLNNAIEIITQATLQDVADTRET